MKMREEKRAAIRDLIRTSVAENAFPCASVLAGTPDEVLFEYAAGSRSVYPEKLPLDQNTLFDMASLTKVLATAPLAMVFVEQGRISLADKVADYLPSFSEGAGKDITLGQLLTHTAGLAPDLALYDLCDKPEDDIRQIAEHGIRFPAGTQVKYSDLAYPGSRGQGHPGSPVRKIPLSAHGYASHRLLSGIGQCCRNRGKSPHQYGRKWACPR